MLFNCNIIYTVNRMPPADQPQLRSEGRRGSTYIHTFAQAALAAAAVCVAWRRVCRRLRAAWCRGRRFLSMACAAPLWCTLPLSAPARLHAPALGSWGVSSFVVPAGAALAALTVVGARAIRWGPEASAAARTPARGEAGLPGAGAGARRPPPVRRPSPRARG